MYALITLNIKKAILSLFTLLGFRVIFYIRVKLIDGLSV